MKKHVLKISVAAILMQNLVGCSTLYNHMSYPYTVTDDKNFVEESVSKNTENLSDGYMFCTQKIPKHSSLIMIPVIGSIADALMITNKAWVNGWTWGSTFPLVGIYTYFNDTQCTFKSYYLEGYNNGIVGGADKKLYLTKQEIDEDFYKPKKAIHHAFVDQAINQSNANCNKYQMLIKAEKDELEFTVNSADTAGNAASTIAGVAGNAATSGGFSAANMILKKLSSDVDKIIYNGDDLSLIFKTADTKRQVYRKCLYNHDLPECKDYKNWHMQVAEVKDCKTTTDEKKNTSTGQPTTKTENGITTTVTKETVTTTKTETKVDSGCDDANKSSNGSPTWMEQSEFIDFMNAYDRACFLPQAKISSQNMLDAANKSLLNGPTTADSLHQQNSEGVK